MGAKTLSAFFAQNAKKVENVKYVASNRFLDEDGKPMEWEICCITAKENATLRKACQRQVPIPGKKNQFTVDFDANAYLAMVSARCTVFPPLDNAELQNSYGVMDAPTLIATMLTPGELEDYSAKVLEVNGFESAQELVDTAKN